ncbi:transglutaminase domain-containing protein [Candidatus Poribacteria bacterium]|jgi:transglutaminase-like putative cysteine protease|nr:transglutaminase domain-containing protein [Candidatus Poribacteria bacterium]MBT5536591.1 transglutaminase domain-containing protein [Candidatus Poribacteria bacterium]MBT7100812.1 transglutaminase domain-containing protein [Candidatus Poribacteria bacterium]MBT7805889.1 transglutaminase domain-containing protein [Candidatus Poribacteria bacterium]
MRRVIVVTAVCVFLALGGAANAERQRHLEFTYTATVNEIPEGADSVRLWMPYPVSNAYQDVLGVRVESPFATEVNVEEEYGNTVLYIDATEADEAFTVTMTVDVVRREQVAGETGGGKVGDDLRARLLREDALVPISGRIADLSVEATQGAQKPLKARAIYDHVTELMTYDKSGEGWGRGDAIYACDVKTGNCTDFHSLIIGMARAAKIPAIFEIGFPIPPADSKGTVGGYHCWAELYIDGSGWVPVDSSEASKHPEMFDYYYGNLDENRIYFSRGRDITLAPPQEAGPVNYLIYPYVEVDGEIHAGVEKSFAYRDLETIGSGSH